MAIEPLERPGTAVPERVATQYDFGRELTAVRERAGLTVRQVARAAGLPASTVGDYFAGRHLPPAGQPEVLPKILAACGETDPAQVAAWMSALTRSRRTPGRRPAGAPAPYRGLASYQPENADLFFGREELTDRLDAEAARARAAGMPLLVLGPSGSGKSSLLRAGLMPRLRGCAAPAAGAPPVVLFTPGASPLSVLAGQVCTRDDAVDPALIPALRADPRRCPELAGPPGGGAAIIVDQFEEAFASCDDVDEREAFITALCALSEAALVVLGVRADFYASALGHPELARALQEHQVVVGPMTAPQLRRAIVEPARIAGVHVEDGLVELMLADLRMGAPAGPSRPAHEPGTLPLLSHALLATWEGRSGGRLTVAGYRASGGIHGAVARTAETAYASLDSQQQAIARGLFLRLVHVAEDGVDTRGRVPLHDLADAGRPGGLSEKADRVLARFVEDRLITVGSDTAEITHEALLEAWPRLHRWIDADRAGLRTRRRIIEAARGWQDADRDDGALLRGTQLAVATDWAAEPAHRASLSVLAREFIDAAADRDQADRRAVARRNRQLRRLVAALAVLVLAAATLAGYALRQRQVADAARASADSRGTAIEADQIRGQDVSLAAQLSLAAYRIAATPDALASTLESTGTPMAARLIDSQGVVQGVALSPDHRLLAVPAADGTLRLWDLARRGLPVPAGRSLTPPGQPLYTAAVSPDGTLLAAAGAAGTIRLWELGGHARAISLPSLTGPRGTVYSLAFSPDGAVLAAGSADNRVWLWDVASPGHARLLARLAGPAGYVESVAFSPNGRTLAAGSADDTVRLWNLADPSRPQPLGRPLTGPSGPVTSVAFSPGGTELAVGSRDDTVRLWNLADPARPVPGGAPLKATDWVNSVAFSPDGTVLAAGSSDDTVRLWNAATGALLATLPHPEPVTSLAWDGPHRLISGVADGTVRLWALPAPVLAAGGPANSVAFAPDGTELAVGGPRLELWNPATRAETDAATAPGTFVNAVAFQPARGAAGARGGRGSVPPLLAAGYGNGSLELWRTAGGRLARLSPPLPATATGMIEFLAFSPRQQILASAGDDGTVRLWDIANPDQPRALATIRDSRTYVFSVAFSPDGRVLAAASADDKVRLWDVASPSRPVPLGRPLTGPTSYVYSVAFSPDQKILAVGSADKTVRLWDVANPSRPVPLGKPLTGPGGYVYSLTFSPRGGTLAAGVTDGTVWLWGMADPARPRLDAELTGPAGHIYSVAFSPDGRLLAAASADGTARIWDTSAAAAAAAICAGAGQPLTRAEWARYIPGRPYDPPCQPTG